MFFMAEVDVGIQVKNSQSISSSCYSTPIDLRHGDRNSAIVPYALQARAFAAALTDLFPAEPCVAALPAVLGETGASKRTPRPRLSWQATVQYFTPHFFKFNAAQMSMVLAR